MKPTIKTTWQQVEHIRNMTFSYDDETLGSFSTKWLKLDEEIWWLMSFQEEFFNHTNHRIKKRINDRLEQLLRGGEE